MPWHIFLKNAYILIFSFGPMIVLFFSPIDFFFFWLKIFNQNDFLLLVFWSTIFSLSNIHIALQNVQTWNSNGEQHWVVDPTLPIFLGQQPNNAFGQAQRMAWEGRDDNRALLGRVFGSGPKCSSLVGKVDLVFHFPDVECQTHNPNYVDFMYESQIIESLD